MFVQKLRAVVVGWEYDGQVAERKAKQNTRWLVGQAAKTLPSHGRISGSIPLRATESQITIVIWDYLF